MPALSRISRDADAIGNPAALELGVVDLLRRRAIDSRCIGELARHTFARAVSSEKASDERIIPPGHTSALTDSPGSPPAYALSPRPKLGERAGASVGT